jgi:hypothetical protein
MSGNEFVGFKIFLLICVRNEMSYLFDKFNLI